MADDAPGLDYVVVKPDRYDFGDGEVLLEHGTIIPGAIAESWGNGLMHLVNLGRLSPIPAVEDDHPRKYDVTAEPPVIEAAEPGTTVEPNREDLVEALDLLGQLASLQDELESKDAEIADLNEKLEAAQVAAGEEPTIEVEGDDEAEEDLARFDALDSAELVAEISAWGTGDGSDESPAVLKPSAEIITGLRDHEAATGNRQDVLDALEAQLAEPETEEPPAEEPPADEKPFPQHKGGGVFTLSDGSEVKGKAAAVAAQATLDPAPEA